MLVSHTADHAVDAPRSPGASKLQKGLRIELAEDADEPAWPRQCCGRGRAYKTYRLGPFEVSFTPAIHSRSCCSDSPSLTSAADTLACLNAYSPAPPLWMRISIAVAGLRFYHQGSANRSTTRSAWGVDVFLRQRRPRLHRGLLEADSAAARTPRRSPATHATTSSAHWERRWSSWQRPALRAASRDQEGECRYRAGGAAAATPTGIRLPERTAPDLDLAEGIWCSSGSTKMSGEAPRFELGSAAVARRRLQV